MSPLQVIDVSLFLKTIFDIFAVGGSNKSNVKILVLMVGAIVV